MRRALFSNENSFYFQRSRRMTCYKTFFQVSSEMTAGRVCAEVVAIKKLLPNIDWVLFEVIDNGAMGEYCTIQGKKKHLVCSQQLNDWLVRNDVHAVDPLLALGHLYSRDSCSGPMGCRE